MNDHPTTLSEVEHYYQEREQRLLVKLHQQEPALTVAEQTLKQLIKIRKHSWTKQTSCMPHRNGHSKKNFIEIL